ncbi:hypothetical protein JZ751_028888 [Albula glossodonta]|uniref:Uncharacterized protein n=1 Tax=Albula glossodonta TaxID=121402 RepID=A0A8T2NDE7_9TELE|nr:hypothetical protein JZ751_028888 [Albula glossodonta]
MPHRLERKRGKKSGGGVVGKVDETYLTNWRGTFHVLPPPPPPTPPGQISHTHQTHPLPLSQSQGSKRKCALGEEACVLALQTGAGAFHKRVEGSQKHGDPERHMETQVCARTSHPAEGAPGIETFQEGLLSEYGVLSSAVMPQLRKWTTGPVYPSLSLTELLAKGM